MGVVVYVVNMRKCMYAAAVTMNDVSWLTVKTLADMMFLCYLYLLQSFFFGGEGLVMIFSGQGRVWIQVRMPLIPASTNDTLLKQ